MNETRPNNSSDFFYPQSPWNQNENVIWLGSTLRLIRNLEKFKFPSKLQGDRRQHLFSLLTKSFLHLSDCKNPTIYQAEKLAPKEREYLIEHFLLLESLSEMHVGTGFGTDETGQIIVLFNISDHIQIQITDTSGDLEKTWERLVKLECEFEKDTSFAFSPKFGYLTSNPLVCGTGLIVSAYLHLPGIIFTKAFIDIIDRERSEGILATGIQGNPDEFLGDIVLIRNLYTVGINEESILSTIRNAILRLVVHEKGVRSTLKNEKPALLQDAISRSMGLLKHSFQIDAQEALKTISLVKLGIELGWIQGMKVQEVNSLIFDSRRSHLVHLTGDAEDKEHVARQRAEYLRRAFEPITLKL